MEQRKIPKMNYWAARGLAEFHKQLKKKLETVETMIAIMLGEPEDPEGSGYYGHVSDGLWEEIDMDEILRRLSVGIQGDDTGIRD